MISAVPNMTLPAEQVLFAVRGARTNQQMLVVVVSAAVVIALICLAVYAITYLVNRWQYNSPTSLFRGLCRLHGLNRNARQLLRRVARYHRLAHPARVFTEPGLLDSARLSPSSRAFQAALGERLFAEQTTKQR
jgi:hypothetical protein